STRPSAMPRAASWRSTMSRRSAAKLSMARSFGLEAHDRPEPFARQTVFRPTGAEAQPGRWHAGTRTRLERLWPGRRRGAAVLAAHADDHGVLEPRDHPRSRTPPGVAGAQPAPSGAAVTPDRFRGKRRLGG